jgi:hypothetical protein
MNTIPDPAAAAEQRLLEALAERYAGAGFTAWSAAADIPGELWAAAGVARPGAGWCGSWLRARKGQAHGFDLTGEPDRAGVNRWRLRGMGRPPRAAGFDPGSRQLSAPAGLAVSRPGCPVAAAEDALLLISSGRVDMARRVLEALPALLTGAERERLLAENDGLRARLERAETALAQRRDLEVRLARTARELSDLKATLGVARKAAAKPLAKPHERLAAALATGRVTAERVAGLLKVEPRHALEIASGRVSLSSTYWRRVLVLLEGEAR